MSSVFFITLLSACNSEPTPEALTPQKEPTTEVQEEKTVAPTEKKSVREIPRPRIHARHILISHSAASAADPALDRTKEQARNIANQLLQQVQQGVDFERLAKEHSDDASGKRGGDLGVFTKGIMHKTFEEATLALDIGAHSNVVETPFGFHIIERLPVIEVKSPIFWFNGQTSIGPLPSEVAKTLCWSPSKHLLNSMQGGRSRPLRRNIPTALLVAAAEI